MGVATDGGQEAALALEQAALALLVEINAQSDVLAQSGTIAGINQAVEISPDGRDALVIQVVGTYTGILSLQASVNGVTWVTLGGAARMYNVATGLGSAAIASATQGIFETGVSGFTKLRVIALAAVTGSAVVTLRAVDGNSLVALDASLPAGTNAIGSITGAVTATPPTPSSTLLVGGATLNPTVVKATAGTLYALTVFNPTMLPVVLKLYNKSTAPAPATDAPLVSIPIAAGLFTPIQFGALGIRFSAGIAFATLANIAANDATAVGAGLQITTSYV